MSKCLAFFSAKSTCCVKLHKTAKNVGAKSEKCLCEQLRCPKHAERGKSQYKKTLQVPFPTECCGTSQSSHLFVGSGGCDWACLRKHAEPGKSARRFRTSLRLTAAEQTSVHIGSSNFFKKNSSSKLPELELQPRGKSLPWSSCSRRC